MEPGWRRFPCRGIDENGYLNCCRIRVLGLCCGGSVLRWLIHHDAASDVCVCSFSSLRRVAFGDAIAVLRTGWVVAYERRASIPRPVGRSGRDRVGMYVRERHRMCCK